jgi:hypothetical protein
MIREPAYLQDLIHEHTTGELLRSTLEASVPFRILELKQFGGPLERDFEEARAFAEVLGSEGDALLFRGHKKGDTARVMRGLIRALAVAAFAPGGVTAFGLHFEAVMEEQP